MEPFLFIGLPYVAIVTAIVGTVYRFRSKRYGISARSSQFLENRTLVWGSVPWHIGVVLIALGHVVPIALPSLWRLLVTSRAFLLTVETIGLAAGILSAVGLVILIARRIVARRMPL